MERGEKVEGKKVPVMGNTEDIESAYSSGFQKYFSPGNLSLKETDVETQCVRQIK